MQTQSIIASLEDHHRDGLLRMRIWSKLKGGDLKGAHKLARPVLENLSVKAASGEAMPMVWVKLSQALCAKDIQGYGTKSDEFSQELPKAQSWIEKAYEVVSKRLKGLVESLVPATMAIALMAQVLQPLDVQASNPMGYSLFPDQTSLSLEHINGEGKIQVKAQSNFELDEVSGDTTPALSWTLESRGEGTLLDRSKSALNASATMPAGKEGHKPSIEWSLGEVSVNSETGEVSTVLIAENTSDRDIGVDRLDFSDAQYKGCSLKINESYSQEFNEYRSPLDLPAYSKAHFKLSIKDLDSLPFLMFNSSNGESHSLLLRVQELSGLRGSREDRAWAKFSARNMGSEPIVVQGLDLSENVALSFGYIERAGEGREVIKIDADNKGFKKFTLYPADKVYFSVDAHSQALPTFNLRTQTEDGSTKVKYSVASPKLDRVYDIFSQMHRKLVETVFDNAQKNKAWDTIQAKKEHPPITRTAFSILENFSLDNIVRTFSGNRDVEKSLTAQSPKLRDLTPMGIVMEVSQEQALKESVVNEDFKGILDRVDLLEAAELTKEAQGDSTAPEVVSSQVLEALPVVGLNPTDAPLGVRQAASVLGETPGEISGEKSFGIRVTDEVGEILSRVWQLGARLGESQSSKELENKAPKDSKQKNTKSSFSFEDSPAMP